MLALPNPATGKSLADLEKIARDTLLEFEERGVLEDDLERVKMNIISGKIYGRESVAGKVSELAQLETFTGTPNFTAEDIARYEAVTAADVERVYRQYIKDKPAVIMSIVPKGQPDAVTTEDTWTRPERQMPDYAAVAEDDLEFRRGVDDFDRSVIPPAGENPVVVLPETWRDELDNGIELLGAVNSETPTTSIQLRIEVGQRHESLEQLGLASLTAAMLNESTQKRSNEEISNELQKLGSSVSFSAGNDASMLTIRSLSKNIGPTMAIAAERLLQPKFDESDFARVQGQVIQGIRAGKKNAGVTADVVYQLLLFGEDNSFSYLNSGTEESVARLTLEDVKAFYEAHYVPEIAQLIAVSNLPRQKLRAELDVFDDWQGDAPEKPPLAEFPDTGETRIYLVDKPDAAQSEIRIGKRSMTYDATGEYYRSVLMNYPLGGAFNSRINLNLREDKGYTYGARSGFSGNKEYGSYTASAAVRTDATADSIVQFEDEIRAYGENGISEEELAFTRKAIGQRDARSFETPGQKLNFIAQMLIYDLDESFVDTQNEILSSIGEKELNALAAKHLDLDDMIIVVVGDKETILPDLKKLGYEIVELDENGNLVET
jgi:zinc protease